MAVRLVSQSHFCQCGHYRFQHRTACVGVKWKRENGYKMSYPCQCPEFQRVTKVPRADVKL